MHHRLADDHQHVADHKERDKQCEVALNVQRNGSLRAYVRILGEIHVIDAKIAGYEELEKASPIGGVVSEMVVMLLYFVARPAVAADRAARSEPTNRSRALELGVYLS